MASCTMLLTLWNWQSMNGQQRSSHGSSFGQVKISSLRLIWLLGSSFDQAIVFGKIKPHQVEDVSTSKTGLNWDFVCDAGSSIDLAIYQVIKHSRQSTIANHQLRSHHNCDQLNYSSDQQNWLTIMADTIVVI